LLDKSRQKPGKILSVEDEPEHAEFIQKFFLSFGYEVATLSDPRNFEEAISGFQPDLVLLDVMLPGMTGHEVARFIRQDDRFATLPVVFLTAQHQLDFAIESARTGGEAHLVKPVDPQLLLATVAARLERSRFLKTLMYRDGLTRLLTHTAFIEQTKAVVAQLSRNRDRSAALVLADLDNFKGINSRYGHPVGDKVLVALAGLFKRRLRQSDQIGRFSGQQFAVVLEDLVEHEAVSLFDYLVQDFAAMEYSIASGATFTASFSAGVAMYTSKMTTLDEWFEAAVRALAQAKQEGRRLVRTAAK